MGEHGIEAIVWSLIGWVFLSATLNVFFGIDIVGPGDLVAWLGRDF